jgi:hypothetical protein
MVTTAVIAAGLHHDDVRRPVVPGSDKYDWRGTVAMVVRTRVIAVIGATNNDGATEIGVTEAERETDVLGLCDSGSEGDQQARDDEYAFHG